MLPPRDENGEVIIWLLLPDREDPTTLHQVMTTMPVEHYEEMMAERESYDAAIH